MIYTAPISLKKNQGSNFVLTLS